jgi:1,2-diacylglycerol 3-alpha-glucosyltransferase
VKIAVASSGLGHIARGVESWALDTKRALVARDVDVTLFAGAAGVSNAIHVPCAQRNSEIAQRLAKWSPPFLWRWGLKSAYGWEQLTFWRHLKKQLSDGHFDILHVQDPMVAYWCQRAYNRGRTSVRVILAHGTEESFAFRGKLTFVQELAPWHLEQAQKSLSAETVAHWQAIPNFVDTDTFYPVDGDAAKCDARRRFDIPKDAFVVGCVAAIKVDHKRIDYLIQECARAIADGKQDLFLVVAGSRQHDTEQLLRMAHDLLGERVRMLVDVPRDDIAELHRTFDVFTLTSLFEMMPIALLEALATGLPCLVNQHPVLTWMAGSDAAVAMGRDGALAEALARMTPANMAEKGSAARAHALAEFATEAVIGRYIDYYQKVMTA